MIAVSATFAAFPLATSCAYLAFMAGLNRAANEGWHVEGLAVAGPSAANECAPGPASGLARNGCKAGEACGLCGFEGSEPGPFDQEREGG